MRTALRGAYFEGNNMIQKNQYLESKIESLTLEGSGVAHADGFALFVPLTAPGDKARIKVVKVLR